MPSKRQCGSDRDGRRRPEALRINGYSYGGEGAAFVWVCEFPGGPRAIGNDYYLYG